MNSSNVVLFPVPAMPDRKTFPPDCIRLTAFCCSESRILVIGDMSPKEMDCDGNKSCFWIVRSVENPDFVSDEQLSCNALGFID